MKKEDKELLFKELCARFPYNIMVKYNNHVYEVLSINKDTKKLTIWKNFGYSLNIKFEYCKLYLFPLSSMTMEQEIEFNSLIIETPWKLIDWFNKNHFDYRGLIPMGLANDATNTNVYD